MRDTWGVQARITALVADAGANAVQGQYRSAASTLSAQNVEVELVTQTRKPTHACMVAARLQAVGFAAELY